MNRTSRHLSLLLIFLAALLVSSARPGRGLAQADPPPYPLNLPFVSSALTFDTARVGPFIARVLGVGRDPYNPATLYASTFGSGMYKSVDYGASWQPASVGISYLTLQAMTVDPS